MSQFIELANKLKQIGREGSFDVDTFFSMIDSSDVNFKINGIQEDNTLIPITGSTSSSYIIKNLGSIHSGFGSTSGWGINDIVNYDTVEQNFKILLDASSEKQYGTIVFNLDDSKFYGFTGSNWTEITTGIGSQGFQGVTGPTGVQGFQGHTGFQGTTGPAGSGKYFYGPTAPENTAEGLTLGSKWFNTEVGGEFTYLSDPGNNPYWVMTNVFSATGPQGPIGGGTGNQGFQGPTGPKGDPGEAAAQGNTGPTGVQGFQGPTGVKGETGDGLFDTSYATGTNVNNSINYNSIGNVTGTGRKFPVLLDDGSLTFDFIRTTDLFNNFTISSFDLTEAAVVLIGTGLFSLNGRTFNVSYTPDIIEVSSASISVNTTNTGYPLSLSDPYTFVSATGTSIDYPTSKNSIVTFTITATASDGSSDTATDTITFRQYNYWGIGSETGITVGNLSSLSNNQLLSNRTKTFTVSPGVGQYIYYGYPESYGDATFKVDGIIGGFQKITISGGETHTNANAYDEKYRIYRSDSANLGNTTVEVT